VSKNAQDFVTPQARYADHARDMSGVAGAGGQGVAMYPLYGLGQTAPDPNAWYRRPMIVFPVGVAAGVGIGWAIWGWWMPRVRKNVRKSIQRGQED
jgi:hypothetical protein